MTNSMKNLEFGLVNFLHKKYIQNNIDRNDSGINFHYTHTL